MSGVSCQTDSPMDERGIKGMKNLLQCFRKHEESRDFVSPMQTCHMRQVCNLNDFQICNSLPVGVFR